MTKSITMFGFESIAPSDKDAGETLGNGVATVVGYASRIDGVACRGARAMLGLSQVDLCRQAGVGRNLLNDFELGTRVPRTGNVERLRVALEGAGALFLELSDGTMLVGVREVRPVDPGGAPVHQ